MINSDDIYGHIEAIAATPGKNAKRDLLKPVLAQPLGELILKLALDPFAMYGIDKVPVKRTLGAAVFDGETFQLLNRLEKRELTGNAARGAVQNEIERLTENSAELLKRILKKDLRAGFGINSVNKVKPGTIAVFDVMLAHKFEPKRIKSWPMIAERKLDGVRTLAFVNPKSGVVEFLSRSGKPFTTFDLLKPHLLDAVKREFNLPFVFDGEVITGGFNKTVSEVRKKSEQAEDAEFHIFDAMTLAEFEADTFDMPYVQRRKRLHRFDEHFTGTSLRVLPLFAVNSHEEIIKHAERVWGEGGEGLIIKDPHAPYVKDRSHFWMKIKQENSVDAPVVDAVEGTGKYEGLLGALVIDVDGVRVNVGSGLSDQQRVEFWDAHQKGELAGRIIEVEYHEKLETGSLRHPRFKRFRSGVFTDGGKE